MRPIGPHTARPSSLWFLERQGHTVETAASGREALDVVAGQPFDLILSDLRMPDVDGPALHQELAARDPEPLPRLVFMTGASLAVDLAAFLRRTGAEVIERPFEPDDLVRRVQDWLGP